MDLTNSFNTILNPGSELRFQSWLKQSGRTKDLKDYDLRGWWLTDVMQGGLGGHLTDTYKKPNHPTFSIESIYSNDIMKGGEWLQQGNKWQFKASPFNLKMQSKQELQSYFNKVEPGNELILPPGY